MIKPKYIALAILMLTLPVMLVLASCGSDDADEDKLTRADVEEIVQSAIASIPAPQDGVTAAEVEEIVRDVIDSIPTKEDPAEYTKHVVSKAIDRYDNDGLSATLSHYNRESAIDGQWYVFIIDENDIVIGHPDRGRLGLDLKGWVGTDANGYNFGPEMLSATAQGKWVSYVYFNPESSMLAPDRLSDVELKNAWVVRHDGLLFGSGWYIDVDQLTQDIAAAIMNLFNSAGLEETIQQLANDPTTVLGGIAQSAVAYNVSGAVAGEWSAFIADESGTIQLHFNPARIGTSISDLLGVSTHDISEQGDWLTSDTMRVWTMRSNGWVFGAGWVDDGS